MSRLSSSSFCRILPALIVLLLMTHDHPAEAAQELRLIDNQSQLIKLAEPPSTVVVGNPAIADITTDGTSLFFHPRAPGVTNVIAMDAKGGKLADYLVRVIFQDSYSVAMYTPTGRRTYSCVVDCELILRLGDNNDYFDKFTYQAEAKNTLSSTQAMGEDLLVPQYSPFTFGIQPQ
ncbi:hypothetical protein DK847_02640 [Aestuariivirga litoralis]|uniref:Pilus formation protein N-terminal domain-containing protein n=2 Tax=Aestuariivirga litoralis TaxID=2650924 RepID=A0A2W2B1F1_9HYPH|nr:hypothetical protein DK847_02640 [Aestuariivirga litoralis]